MIQPDQTGGLGSFLPALQGTLTKGLEYIVAGELGKRYGFSFGADDTLSVNTKGDVTPAAAPAASTTATEEVTHALANSPLIVAALVAGAIAIVVALVRR